MQHQENEGTVLTSELSMTCSHTENKRTSTIPKLYRLEGTPAKLLTPSSAAPQLPVQHPNSTQSSYLLLPVFCLTC